ncbi:hypothetical protein, partial [Mycobacterium simiae]|uniref:hypothetical protein n=1 Tax=Mycobacterium simiae TaxID=1784 RepID=UPI001E5193FA
MYVGVEHANTTVWVRFVEDHDVDDHAVTVVTVFTSAANPIGHSVTIDPRSDKTYHTTRDPNTRELIVNPHGVISVSLKGQPHYVGVGKKHAGTEVRVEIVEDHDVRVVTVFDSAGNQINESVTIDLNSDRRSHTTLPPRDLSTRKLTVNRYGQISLSLHGQPHRVGLGIDNADTEVRVEIVEDDHGVAVVTAFDSAGNQINESVTIDLNSGKTSHTTLPTRDPSNRELKVSKGGKLSLSLHGQTHKVSVGKKHAGTHVRVEIVEDHDVRVVTVFDSAGNRIRTVTIDLNSGRTSHSDLPPRGGAAGGGA